MTRETAKLLKPWNGHRAGATLREPKHVIDALRSGGFIAPEQGKELTVAELKRALRAAGLPTTGSKAELLARLQEKDNG
jgi:hypothetical protein